MVLPCFPAGNSSRLRPGALCAPPPLPPPRRCGPISSSCWPTTSATPISACFGGEIRTPNLDSLAKEGVRFTHFYNTARCCPSRATLLSGLYAHQAGVGHMVNPKPFPAYSGDLNRRLCHDRRSAQALRVRDVHVGQVARHAVQRRQAQLAAASAASTVTSASSEARRTISTRTASSATTRGSSATGPISISPMPSPITQSTTSNRPKGPFFLYTAFTSPHWPLHALEPDIERYQRALSATDGTRCVRSAASACSHGHPRQALAADARAIRRRPRGPTPPTRIGISAAWRCTPRRSTAWTRTSAASWARCEARASSKDASYVPCRQRRVRRGTGAGIEPLPMSRAPANAASTSRPVTFRRSCPAGEQLSKLRTAVGERVQHAVPPLQALGARGRNLDAVHRPLAHRNPRAQYAHAPAGSPHRHYGDVRRRGGCPIPVERSADGGPQPRARVPGPQDRALRRDLLGARGQPRDSRRQVEARFAPSGPMGALRFEADRSELNDLAAREPATAARLSAMYDKWSARVGVVDWPTVQKAPAVPTGGQR